MAAAWRLQISKELKSQILRNFKAEFQSRNGVFAFGTSLSIASSGNPNGSKFLIWVILLPVISSFSYQLDGIFTGATKTRDMRNGAIISFFIFIIATIVLVPVSGNHGLWVSYILFILLRAITLSLKFSGLQREITLLK